MVHRRSAGESGWRLHPQLWLIRRQRGLLATTLEEVRRLSDCVAMAAATTQKF